MRNRIDIDIDSKHSRAIVQEVGERLRAFLQEEPEPPESLRTQINRLCELEEQPFQRLSVGTSVAIEPLWTAQTARPDMDEQSHR
jgi:hypothetical protein